MAEKKNGTKSTPFRLFGKKVSPAMFLATAATDGVGFHFGQSAEDVILLRLFKKIKGDIRNGYYVDVGAFHPRKYSNTFILHNFFGWKGINIDASKEAIALFEQERPEDINIHSAIGGSEGEAVYWKFKSPEINTLSKNNIQRQLKKGKEVISKENVKVRTLSDILDENLPDGKDIDLLNIDVEGLDLQTLKSNDWTKFRPIVVLIEDYSIQISGLENSDIYRYMKDVGYKFFSHTFDTSIYVKKEFIEREPVTKLTNIQINTVNCLEDRESDIFNRAATLAKVHPYWNEKFSNLERKLVKLNTLYENLEKKREQNINLMDKLKEKEIELKEVRAENEKYLKDLKFYEKKYKAIKQSRTWRYTAPLRKIMKRVKFYKNLQSPPKKKTIDLEKNQRRIRRIKVKLFNLGFSERAKAELWELVRDNPNPVLKRLAASELSLWYANQRSKEGASQCLKLIPKALEGEEDPNQVRKLKILEVESHEILGNLEKAKDVVSKAIANNGAHTDLYLSAANLETNIYEKLKWINKALEHYNISKISVIPSERRSLYDCLIVDKKQLRYINDSNGLPKVTVIIPVYNAELTIKTALDSVLAQTWTNLEIFVVDDCSTDRTTEIVKEYESKDPRITLMQTETNGGPYVARNLAMSVATGDFVTVNDADDWSHPEKIEKQVKHLINNPSVIGNTSQQARATNDLKFYRRGNYRLMFANMSSFMFRRKPVMDKVGYLDSVRFAADAEFIRRVKKVFGKSAVVNLTTGPLSFQRQSDESLTGNSAFGFHGYFMGARKEYVESQSYYHKHGDNLRYEFPQKSRPFPVPEPMWPIREVRNSERRYFDVIFVSDFRLTGTRNLSFIEEIKDKRRLGLRIGLIQMYRYDLDPNKKVTEDIRKMIDGDQVQMLVYGEKINCESLIILDYQILLEWQRFIPDVKTNNISVIVDELIIGNSISNYSVQNDINKCQHHLRKYFGKSGIWYPINQQVRKLLYDNHIKDIENIIIEKRDWIN